MVTFLAGIPADEVTGSKNMLTGIFAKDGKNFFCAKSAGETTWKEGEEVPSNFPLKEIYSTVFTNASGIKQTVVVGNVEETVEATTPWFSNDRLFLPSYEESSNHVLWKPIPHDGWRV